MTHDEFTEALAHLIATDPRPKADRATLTRHAAGMLVRHAFSRYVRPHGNGLTSTVLAGRHLAAAFAVGGLGDEDAVEYATGLAVDHGAPAGWCLDAIHRADRERAEGRQWGEHVSMVEASRHLPDPLAS